MSSSHPSKVIYSGSTPPKTWGGGEESEGEEKGEEGGRVKGGGGREGGGGGREGGGGGEVSLCEFWLGGVERGMGDGKEKRKKRKKKKEKRKKRKKKKIEKKKKTFKLAGNKGTFFPSYLYPTHTFNSFKPLKTSNFVKFKEVNPLVI